VTARSGISWLCALVATATLGACSDPASSEPDGVAGGGSAARAGAGGASAGNGAGGSPAAGSPSSGGTQPTAGAAGQAGGSSAGHFGQVLVQRWFSPARVSLYPRFVESQSGFECEQFSEGSCTASVCSDAASVTKLVSAGTVTVTSDDVTGSATAVPDASGDYLATQPVVTFDPLFGGEEHLLIKASGGEVPAFEGALDVPLVLLLSQPVFVTGGAALQVSRDQDLPLLWTRGVQGVMLYVRANGSRADGLPGSAGVSCEFNSTDGSGTVKATLLQKLAADSTLNLYTAGIEHVQAGDYDVALAILTGVGNPEKSIIPSMKLQ
jgi:hypothetical protein